MIRPPDETSVKVSGSTRLFSPSSIINVEGLADR